MIVQEPVQAAIWHALNHYAYNDAIFLAERLCSEVDNEDTLFLLATCYYRSGQVNQAHFLLSSKASMSPQCKFLLAKCSFELKQYSDAETTLTGEDHLRTQHFDEITTEFGEIACFALQLLSKICQQTERTQLANEASHKVVKLNPFLFHSFTDLCNRGEKPDPEQIFQLSNADVFQNSQCRQSWYGGGGLWAENSNNSFLINNSSSDIMAMMNNSIGNGNSNSYNNLNILSTPLDQIAAPNVLPPQQTPNNTNVNIANALRGMGGAVIEDSTPLCNYQSGTETTQPFDAAATPFRKNFKYLSAYSPTTPSFGVLPLMSSPGNDGFLNVTPSPQLQQLASQQMDTTEPQQQQTNNKSMANSKKLKNNIGIITRNISKMEAPPSVVITPQTLLPPPAVTTVVVGPLQHTKPVFQQTGNITTPRTPNTLNAGVRRSSRLFSSNNNYSVAKENTKSPHITNNNNINNKFATPRSPARKTKQRASKINLNNASLQELNEKKEKVETITSGIDSVDTKVLLNNSVNSAQNFAQRLLMMKKQSADGLMVLLRELGEGYLHLAQYECKEAIKCFEDIPLHHHNSSWVQSMIAIAHHESREYELSVKIFKEIHDREPYRLSDMEIYSTDLWHLQKEVMLSVLAQDVIAFDKKSPITWCVAGNCFSLHKEHETAIKFFRRAIQVDPDFAYSYTLLGHELVMTEELDKALSCYRTAILKDPRHYNAWFGIGNIFSKQERYQLAEIHYRRALQINPKNSVIMVHIAVMQFFLQKNEKAMQTLNQAIAIDPKNPLCKFHRGSMYFSLGRNHEALTELEELKQIVPKESVVYYLIGKIHKKLGNVDSALMYFSYATALDPKGANNQIKDNFDSIIRTQQDASTSNAEQLNADDNEQISERSGSDDSSSNLRTNESGLIGNIDYDSDSF